MLSEPGRLGRRAALRVRAWLGRGPSASESRATGGNGDDRLARLAGKIESAGGIDSARELCMACVDVLEVSGASLMVMAGGRPSLLAASDAIGTRLEEIQHTLGEGPCIDAHDSGGAVGEPDLAHPHSERWMGFGPAALDAGAAALFSRPLRVGGVRLGALTVYQTRPGDLSESQHADASMLAGLVANAVLAIQAESEPGTLSADLEPLMSHRAELHQASGMVSIQLGVGVGEASVRIRAYAFAVDRPLAEVAADIVARRLRLDE